MLTRKMMGQKRAKMALLGNDFQRFCWSGGWNIFFATMHLRSFAKFRELDSQKVRTAKKVYEPSLLQAAG
jgi:hypothetical protein